jgi:uncharacterized protein (TIGR03085 family)
VRLPSASVSTDLDQRERHELSDLLDELGPDQPTLCEGWTTSAMAAHLVVRERQPLAMPGILMGGPFEATTERMMNRELERHGYHGTVERVRSGPPPGPLSFAPVRSRVNLFEMTVHHEDVRRANGGEPRTDRPDLDDAVWGSLGSAMRLFLLRGRVRSLRVELQRPDGSAHAAGPESGSKVVLSGPPVECLLYLQGRKGHARVELTGDDTAIQQFRAATFAI